MRRIYLKQLPRQDALDLLLAKAEIGRKEEWLPVTAALGRVTAQAVFATRSMPAYHAAAMDGIAVRAIVGPPAARCCR